MKRRFHFTVRLSVTALALTVSLAYICRMLTPKHFANEYWPETTTVLEFYQLEEESVDVLFLGTSHAVSAFLPQELYDRYGITSYNLSTELQNLVVSYYWLKEALSTQQPHAVILDTYLLFEFDETEPLNSAESCTRLAMDFMKMGPVKREAIAAICELDENQSAFSYYFPNVRYHTRWEELGKEDFLFEEYAGIPGLMGYSTVKRNTVPDDYSTFTAGASDWTEEMDPLMLEYLDKILALCQEEGIDLILVKTPSTINSSGRYNTTMQYAAEHGIAYYDFNEASLYDAVGFSFQDDMADYGHLLLSGAVKITDYIGLLLQTSYGIEAHEEEDWENAENVYQDYLTLLSLSGITDFEEYLSVLHDYEDRLTIFIAARDEASTSMNEEIIGLLQDFGLSETWEDAYRSSYYAVIDSGAVLLEEISAEALQHNGSFHRGRVAYSICSAGFPAGDDSSIVIGETEYSVNSRGLNIVVYDNLQEDVVDSVCFDTYDPSLAATR